MLYFNERKKSAAGQGHGGELCSFVRARCGQGGKMVRRRPSGSFIGEEWPAKALAEQGMMVNGIAALGHRSTLFLGLDRKLR